MPSRIITTEYTIQCDRCGELIHAGERVRLEFRNFSRSARFTHISCPKPHTCPAADTTQPKNV